jgi:anaerobic ribonucleoside-triphosphate reductase activating protein
MSKINIADFIECTEVEGPGKRFAIWVQGCLRHCPGCCNPHFLDFVPKKIMDSADIYELIEKSQQENDIEGITLLGGEPFLQARGLSEVAKFCKEHNLSVMTFTGYTLVALLAEQIPYTDKLLTNTDLLVDGFFDKSHPETVRNWVGSTNQQFHFLTDFYANGIEYDERFSHGFELRIKLDGTFSGNGYPLNSL